MNKMLLTKEICKAARQLIGWTTKQLSEESGVSFDTLRSFESGRSKSLNAFNQEAVQKTLERAGVQFLEGGDIASGNGVAIKNEET